MRAVALESRSSNWGAERTWALPEEALLSGKAFRKPIFPTPRQRPERKAGLRSASGTFLVDTRTWIYGMGLRNLIM